MSSAQVGDLCSSCMDCNLNNFSKTHPLPREGFDLFWDLRKTFRENQCPFCRLLLQCLQSDNDFDPEDLKRSGLICGKFVGNELQLVLSLKNATITSQHSIQLCRLDGNETQEQLSRIDTSTFNVNELKGWLDRCNTQHDQCGRHDTNVSDLPIGFRLIDIEKGCIVTGSPGVPYCALSYVWGGVRQTTLTESTRTMLETENVFSSDQINLPKTIEQAMQLCRAIGQRYLWVDCLCVLDDGSDTKLNQIHNMDNIYNQAFLTIVAAGGPDANSGLPPFQIPRPRPNILHVSTVGSLELVSSLSPQLASEVISRSVWITRGWTLQEFALSRRTVIFTGQYVFFRCKEAFSAESFGVHNSRFQDSSPGWDLPLSQISPTYIEKGHYLNLYSRFVSEYIHRHLTNSADVLNAFQGVLSRLVDDIGPHIWGLPSKDFGKALLWRTDVSFPARTRKGFPTWTWAGWHHDKSSNDYRDFVKLYHDRHYDHSSVLTCYVVNDGKVICFDEQYFTGAIQRYDNTGRSDSRVPEILTFISKWIKRNLSTPRDYTDRLKQHIAHGPPNASISHCVFFWTSCALLAVDRQVRSEATSDTDLYNVYIPGQYRLLGPIRLNSAWRTEQPNLLKFAAMTMTHTISPHEPWTVPDVKVMLIHRHGNESSIFYSRIQVPPFSIRLYDWEAANPGCYLIALI